MKVFAFDREGCLLDFSLRCQDYGHEVRMWLPKGKAERTGDGMVEKVSEWKPELEWADLVVMQENSHFHDELEPYFAKGYPLFGANRLGAALELDRETGQRVLERCGIETIPYEVFERSEDAIRFVELEKKTYVMKPWGGASDKAMTYVSSSPADMIFRLERWQREGKLKGSFMLQEKISGIEMGVSGFFGPGGWSRIIEEHFEFKKLMNDDLGCNTGEQGTVIRYTHKSQLFDLLLDPLSDYLHAIGYVGDVAVGALIDKRGQPMPMEFTARLGWPDFNIRQELHEGDPAQWMRDLIDGRDTLQAREEVAVGVVVAHGDYPYDHQSAEEVSGFPIYGLSNENLPHVHFQAVMEDDAPMMAGGDIKRVRTPVTAGSYVYVASGSGETVREARDAAYEVAWGIDLPSNRMFRTDIGERLRAELPKLQRLGYADGMEF